MAVEMVICVLYMFAVQLSVVGRNGDEGC